MNKVLMLLLTFCLASASAPSVRANSGGASPSSVIDFITGSSALRRINEQGFLDISGGQNSYLVIAPNAAGTAGSKIAGAAAALAAGGVIDAQALTGEQTLSTDVFAKAASSGKLLLNAATFYTSVTQHVPSNWTIIGQHSGPLSSSISDYNGTVFKWTGADKGQVFRIFNVHNVIIQGITIDGNNVSGSTGILLDSNNNPGTTKISIEDFSIVKAATGVQWGTSSSKGYQSDAVIFRNGHIASALPGAKGIVINSSNAGQTSIIERLFFQQVYVGIDVQHMDGSFAIRSVDCAALSGSAPRCIQAARVNDLLIQDSRDELLGNPVGSRFFVLTGGDYMQGVVTLLHNEINTGAEIQRAAWVLSEGNKGAGYAVIRNAGVRGADPSKAKVVSKQDRFMLDATDTPAISEKGQGWKVCGVDLAVPYATTNYGAVCPSGSSSLGAYVSREYGDRFEITGDARISPSSIPAAAKGQIHIIPRQGVDGYMMSITFGAENGSSNTVVTSTQAGIYVQSSSAYGTRFYFCNADNTLTGPKVCVQINERGQIVYPPTALRDLGTPADGTTGFCSDCVEVSDPCTSGGTGSFAKRLNGRWVCSK